MSCDISGWAGRILDGLGETGIATGQVVVWITENLGLLNDKLDTEYVMESGCPTPEMGQSESGIYTEMYICNYFRKKANQALLTSFDWVEMEGENQGRIKRVSKTQQAEVFRKMSQDCEKRVDDLVEWYRQEQKFIEPRQIVYNYRSGTANVDYSVVNTNPPSSYYSPYNTVWT